MSAEVNKLTCEEELELLRERVDDLEAALRKETEFKTASKLPLPTSFWLYARDMKDFFLTAKTAIAKANIEQKFNSEEHENRKIILQVEMHSGRVKGCYLEA